MATRHQARLAAISLLYSRDMNGGGEDFADEYLEEKRIRNEQRNWTLALLRGASENLTAVDALIDENLKEFKLAEISALERAILRLGAYELRFTDTDAGIVINEAINSAKELGISPRFINGVLDALKDSPVNIEADKISKPNTAGVNSELSTATSENFKPTAAKNSAISDSNVVAKNFIPTGADGETKNFTKAKRSGTPKNSTASRSRPSKKPANLKTRSAPTKKSAASKKFKTERNFKTEDKFKTEKTGKNFKTGERGKNFKAGERGKDATPKKEGADRNFRVGKSAAPKKGTSGKNTTPKSSAGRKSSIAPKKSADGRGTVSKRPTDGRGALSKRPADSKGAVRGKDKR